MRDKILEMIKARGGKYDKIAWIFLAIVVGVFIYRWVLGNELIKTVETSSWGDIEDYNPTKVKTLLYLGAMKGFRETEENWNAPFYGWSDLHFLVWRGDYENVQLYLQLGGDVNIESLHGHYESPLHIALEEKNNAMAQLLLEYGAKPVNWYPGGIHTLGLLRYPEISDETANLVIEKALESKNEEERNHTIASYLCHLLPATFEYRDKSLVPYRTIWLLLKQDIKNPQSLTCPNSTRADSLGPINFLLHFFKLYVEWVGVREIYDIQELDSINRFLLLKAKEAGCKECLTQIDGEFLIHYLLRHIVCRDRLRKPISNEYLNYERYMFDFLEFLLQNGSNPNVGRYYDGKTLLQYAKECGIEEAVRLLQKYGGQ